MVVALYCEGSMGHSGSDVSLSCGFHNFIGQPFQTICMKIYSVMHSNENHKTFAGGVCTCP